MTALAGCQGHTTSAKETPRAQLTGAPLSYADVVERVVPAVVTVRSAKRVRVSNQSPLGNGFLERFFGGGVFGPASPIEEQRSLGSGVIVRSDGYILTNNHVIAGAQEIKVDLNTHQTYPAKLVGADAPSDLAVLKIDANNLPVLNLGNSDQVRVGDICLAVGNPLGIGETVTSGIISAKGRRTGLSNGSYEDFLQTDASINEGNSGGALVNTNAVLIGINSQIISPNGGNIGIGFAIPSNMAQTVMDQLIKTGKVARGHLGVAVQPMTSGLAQNLGVPNAEGVVVSSVQSGSPADKAGLKAGDAIIAMNDKTIKDANTFRNDIASASPGTAITLTIVRDGKQMQLTATLTQLSANAQPGTERSGQSGTSGRLGMTAETLTPGMASELGLNPDIKGVVITNVDPTGPAADAGLQTGDVILQINHQPVHSVSDVEPALSKAANGSSLLLVNRGGQVFFITVSSS